MLCYCGLDMFWDHDLERYLCPARFDGTHSAQQEAAHFERTQRRRNVAQSNGSRGGTQRAVSLNSEQRSAIARAAANSRWNRSESEFQ